MSNKHVYVNRALTAIEDQVSRGLLSHPDADLLKNDLRAIQCKIVELRSLLPKCVTPNGRVDGHYTYVSIKNGKSVCAFCGNPAEHTEIGTEE